MEEPSVYDYIKALLTPWKGKPPELPSEPFIEKPRKENIEPSYDEASLQESTLPKQNGERSSFPWRIVVILVLVILAQRLLEPPSRSVNTAIILYSGAGILLVWSILARELTLTSYKEIALSFDYPKVRFYPFLFSLLLLVLAFLTFSGNLFNPLNTTLWILALVFLFWSLWTPRRFNLHKYFSRLNAFIKKPEINIRIIPWVLLLIITTIIVVFFRFSMLDQVPGEMFSDHAEKLLDVSDVLLGKTSIFFPRNTGREAIQMYLTAIVAVVFNTGLSFLSLKIGTALAGLFTLPYIYLLGKEIGNRWVGLLAFFMAGIAYWPNVISRVGLRFPLYPLFIAPALYYLIRGLRTSSLNYFILSGLAIGIGLHGYSPFRFAPIVIVIAVCIYLLHRQAFGKRWQTILGLVILAYVAFAIFIPLLRYMLSEPEIFNYRALSRLGTTERSLPGPVIVIFLINLWKAMIMFFWDNGSIWVHSVSGRPALDVVTAGLLFIGSILLLMRYVRDRHWLDLFFLLSIPLLMMPSILSLAFPDENPSLNRTGGAIIPVFIIAALALEAIFSTLYKRAKTSWGKGWVIILLLLVLTSSSAQNYDLVFRQYNEQFIRGAWNTSTVGKLIRSFGSSIGSSETAYVVPYPHWVDTRLVGINAGYPLKDYALWPENFSETLQQTESKMFILKPEDTASLLQLQGIYPQGTYWLFRDPIRNGFQVEGKDFIIFFVPPRQP